jgi:PTH1 family peptidyl-tRNA hydrolase
LKSVEEHLGTQDYPRLRIGIGAPRLGQDLADYVLEKFSTDEKASLQTVLEKGADVLEEYLLKEKG